MGSFHFFYVASKIQERHEFLEDTIRYFPEEHDAFFKAWIYFDLSLGFVFIGTFLQWFFFMLYNRNFHPFKDIFIQYDDSATAVNPMSV